MNTDTAASIAAREQYAAQLKRHEDILTLRIQQGIADAWLAAVISRLARAIKVEATDPKPVEVDA